MKKLIFTFLHFCIFTFFGSAEAVAKGGKSVLAMINKVNTTWQANHRAECRGFWDNATYFTGNQAVIELTGDEKYVDYALRWCEYNKWMGAKQTDQKKWKYEQYGEDDDHVFFADWQTCFHVYIDMYKSPLAKVRGERREMRDGRLEVRDERREGRERMIERTLEVMYAETEAEMTDFWWWADALYMGFPVFSKLYTLTRDERLLKKQYECFKYTDDLLYDKDAHLYYRDGKYVWPKVKTACDGGKSFWARGDGWVLAGLAKVLQDLPKDSQYRALYEQRFRELAKAVAGCQQEGGYWTRSMLCPDDAPGYETSGTAFFTYGMLWGVNNGYLSKKEFGPVIKKAWKYLTEVALQEDGTIGYVQPIGEKPDPTRTVNAKSQAPFGTGAWLLAACEYYKY